MIIVASEERPISTEIIPERAYLVGVDWQANAFPAEESLLELGRLAHTAGAEVVASTYQKIEKPNPRFFVGSGKAEEINTFVRANNIDVVIFDDELSPSQQSNLERLFPQNVKVIDRTALILDIFGIHATTREGKLQVQLAQLQYLLPRLRGMWSHLAKEQTRGGIGSRFGMGESQLEIDRRLIRDKISSLKKELKRVARTRKTMSSARYESHIFRVALAGYTNAGKSSLLNTLTDSNILSQDLLFATLDSTTRKLTLPQGRQVALTDTVGFIQKLPTTLIESFNSTLAEVINADLILKVVDISSKYRDYQRDTVEKVLESIGAHNSDAIIVYNKIDLVSPEEIKVLKQRNPESVYVSAETGEGIDELLDVLSQKAAESDEVFSALVPYKDGSLLELAHKKGSVFKEVYTEKGVAVSLRLPKAFVSKFKEYRIDSSKLENFEDHA
ncbi:MAG: GTPase HflX [Coriobacteriia bacterium]|nr:GTPase HflX [Coriobacteriia bacterium]